MAARTKIPFVNNLGKTMELDGFLTIDDLVLMGVTNIKFVEPETPILDGEWRSVSEKDKKGS